MRRIALLLMAAALAVISPFMSALASPRTPDKNHSANFEIFFCRLKSGAILRLRAVRDEREHMSIILVQQQPNRKRVLSALEASYSGFAHGGSAIIRGHTENSTIELFVQEGGVEPSFGAISETTAARTTNQFCDEDSIRTPSSVEGGPHEAPLSLFSLGLRHIAGTLVDPIDWPEE